MRKRIGVVRFAVFQAEYDTAVAATRDTLDENDFETSWAEGASLSTEEAIAYAQRGRGERKRPTRIQGWFGRS